MYTVVVSREKDRQHKELLRIEVPRDWSEVTPEQFRKVFAILYDTFPIPPVHIIRIQIVRRLLGKMKVVHSLSAEQIYDISQSVKFLWDSAPSIAFIPSFKFRGRRYYLPESHLHNAVMIEYIYADSFLAQLAPEGAREYENLDKLVATLCRPAKSFWWWRRLSPYDDGDIRQRFSPALMKRRAKKFKKLPMKYKMYVLAFFAACKHEIVNNPDYNRVFPKPKKGQQSEGGGWIQLLKDVAGLKLYGNYDETAYYNLHTVLTNLQEDIKRQEEKKVNA